MLADLLNTIPWAQVGEYSLKILVAFVLALPIAWERELTTQRIGLRTFPLVAVASCGYVLVSLEVLGANSDAQARIIQGLITGIGFIGGGAILKDGGTVRGTSTAASIWTTGIIGAAVAYEYPAISVIISIVNFVAFRMLTPVVHQIDRNRAELAALEKEQEEKKQEQQEQSNN
jgi:putative Mg2+ transporter-C (MgtC) family protein